MINGLSVVPENSHSYLSVNSEPTPKKLVDASAVRAFIASCYYAAYSARVDCDYPELLAVTDHEGRVLAACGVRNGAQPLFLECYLDEPADMVLSKIHNTSVERESLVEIGNLAGGNGWATRLLFHALWRELVERQWLHVLITCTRQLKPAFGHLPTFSLGDAQAARVEYPEMWGQYYEQHPEIISCSLGQLDAVIAPTRKSERYEIHLLKNDHADDVQLVS